MTDPATSPDTPAPTRRRRTTPLPRPRAELAQEFAALPDDALAATEQVAAWMGVSVSLLERDRWAGGGIPYVTLGRGRAVRYRVRDVRDHVTARVRRSTSDAGGAR